MAGHHSTLTTNAGPDFGGQSCHRRREFESRRKARTRRKAVGNKHTTVCFGRHWDELGHGTQHTVFQDRSRFRTSRHHESIASAWECITTQHLAFVQHLSPSPVLLLLYFSFLFLFFVMGQDELCIWDTIPGVFYIGGSGGFQATGLDGFPLSNLDSGGVFLSQDFFFV
jgi:hypothetical protein